jgi:hypothetical protein
MSQGAPERQLSGIFAVIDDLRTEFPDVPEQCFADARTMMITWLLPAFIKRGLIRQAFGHAARAYLANSHWPLNRHVRWMQGALGGIALKLIWLRLADRIGWSKAFPHVATVEIDGERPFSYLDDARISPRTSGAVFPREHIKASSR